MKTNYKKTILVASLALMGWSNVNAQSIAAGGWHSLVVCSDSTVKAFGENATGELGNNSNTDSSVPVTAIGLTGITSVSGGGDQLEAHSLALKSDGTVWAWGSNIYGGLGDGSTTNTTAPAQVLVLTGINAIAAGGWHSVALKSDKTVWTWGWNIDGQLGIGNNVDKTIPVKVPSLTGVTAIAAGTYHVLALKSDSTVWAWGDNISGQIGDGTALDRTSPVQVSGLTKVIAIAAGRFFSLAIRSDSTVWTWGENVYGQLGDGTTTNSSVPVQVTGLVKVVKAACGAFECHVIKSDGTVWAWGRNTYGNIGDGSIINRSTPVQMSGISSAAGVASGTNFSLVYKSDGTFWACGRNSSGQLGDGTILQRNTLVQSTALCPVMISLGIRTIDPSKAIRITAFPNPSSDGKFTIQMDNDKMLMAKGNKVTINIYNILGEKVTADLHASTTNGGINSGNYSLDLGDQPDGIYFIAIRSGENTSYQKLVKQ